MEKCAATQLPPMESAADYDASGRVLLSAEYRQWLASPENWLGDRVRAAAPSLRILFPLPGATFHLDPDLPNQGRTLYLKAEGGEGLSWTSPTLQCRVEAQSPVAILSPGRHELWVTDPQTGARAQTWITVVGF